MIKCHIRRRSDTLIGEGPTMIKSLSDAAVKDLSFPPSIWHFNFYDVDKENNLLDVEIEAYDLNDAIKKFKEEVLGVR